LISQTSVDGTTTATVHVDTHLSTSPFMKGRGVMFGKTKREKKENQTNTDTLKHSFIVSLDQKIVYKLQQRVEKSL